MKHRIIALAIIALGSMSTYLHAQESATRLELRMMQSRQFSKPPLQVANAIDAFWKDYGGSCMAEPYVEIALKMKKTQTQHPIGCGSVRTKDYDKSIGIMSFLVFYEISWDPKMTNTTVRARMQLGGPKYNFATSENPEIYSKHFKEIADTLFIEAIELNPAKMH